MPIPFNVQNDQIRQGNSWCVSRGQDTLPNPSGRAQALPKFWDTITYFDTEPGNFAQ